ncbi:ATP-binding protein [Terricaulis sp.]|uniref:sensor histidine kinase n=1 Tax=Terricaulis sp. TaxID=2768686 RepID=UPI003783F7ED
MWSWLAAALLVGFLAWLNGGAPAPVAGWTALAIAPAFASFILLPRLGEPIVDAGVLATWLLAGVGLVAGSGGALSPLASVLAVPPALALALGRRWVPEAGAAAVLGYAAGASIALLDGGLASTLGPFPQLLSVVSLAFAAGMMALGQRAPARHAETGARIAEVSHELRTPLTHILGFSEMIERQIFGPVAERYVEYAGLIRKSGTHLLGLVNDLLDLSRMDAGRYEIELESFDARAIGEEVVRMSADAAEKKQIALRLSAPDAPLMVKADSRALRRMLINTIGNAVKFTPDGGRVVLALRREGRALVLETIDNGPGIPEADRAKLGRAYERGSGGARAEGTGLGLALVRSLARLHGGMLSFHEAPGGGALVRITLPVLSDA